MTTGTITAPTITTAEEARAYLKDHAADHIKSIWHLGKAFVLAKGTTPHGEFQAWLAREVPSLSYRTLARYKRLYLSSPDNPPETDVKLYPPGRKSATVQQKKAAAVEAFNLARQLLQTTRSGNTHDRLNELLTKLRECLPKGWLPDEK